MKFDQVEVGQGVIFFGGKYPVPLTVQRVTATTFVAGGQRFMRSNGWEFGCSEWRPNWCEPTTPENVALMHRARERELIAVRVGRAIGR